MKLVFLGPPGAGKGTIAKKMATELDMAHLSTGDIFRKAMSDGTELGNTVKEIMAKGELVSDDLTFSVVKEALAALPADKSYILDGFPRTIHQAELLDSLKLDLKTCNFMLNDEKIIKRLSGRRTCKNCGYGHHIDYMPPAKEGICDKCGGELYIREDDKEESIKNRLKVYYTQTEPLLEYYNGKGNLLAIDASADPETVYKKTKAILGL